MMMIKPTQLLYVLLEKFYEKKKNLRRRQFWHWTKQLIEGPNMANKDRIHSFLKLKFHLYHQLLNFVLTKILHVMCVHLMYPSQHKLLCNNRPKALFIQVNVSKHHHLSSI